MKFTVEWSEEDGEYVALCDKYPSLSFLDENINKAFIGIIDLVESIESENNAR